MADDPKPTKPSSGQGQGQGQGQNQNEADASDLLSLWGSGGGLSQSGEPPQEGKKQEDEKPLEEPKASPAREPEEEESQEEPPSQSQKPVWEEVAEPVEAEIIAPPPAPAAPEEKELLPEAEEGFASQLDDFLRELHLSGKHVFYGIGCLILIIALIFGGIAGFKFLKSRKQEPPAIAPKPPTEISSQETGLSATGQIGSLAAVTPDLIGPTGIFNTILIGTEFEGLNDIAGFLMTFRRMQNAYATDVDELMNKSTDRRSALLSYLALIRSLDMEGTSTLQRIRSAQEVLNSQYEAQRKLQDVADANFFEEVDALNGQTARNILKDFVEASKEVVALRAHFKALQKIRSLYEQGLPRLANRIRSIELNQEALVSGIKIYQIQGADLNLVIPVENGARQTQRLQESSQSSSGIFPSNPAQVSTERDYITDPAGGFSDVYDNRRR